MQNNRNEKNLIEMFVQNLLTTNRGYSFYVNWDNALSYKEFEIELHAMNVLIHNENFEETFINLLKKLPSVICTFPMLFALSRAERESLWKNKSELEIPSLVSNMNLKFNFSKEKGSGSLSNEDIKMYYDFFVGIGLKNLFENLLEKSVVDYIIGVLVGLDTNGRKNRSGISFELLCEEVLSPICKKLDIELLTQKKFKELEKYGISIDIDIADRKADFILIKDKKVMNIEANYYFSAGSKPEEIVDSYINRRSDLEKNNIGFVLITDGMCWNNEYKNQLNKAFRHINIMNHFMASNGVLEDILISFFR